MRNLWIQGGARARAFFADDTTPGADAEQDPAGAVALALCLCELDPRLAAAALERVYATDGGDADLGRAAAHQVPARDRRPLREEKARGEHFADGAQYAAYYDRLTADPVLHSPASTRYTGWRQLEALGLMSRGGWI